MQNSALSGGYRGYLIKCHNLKAISPLLSRCLRGLIEFNFSGTFSVLFALPNAATAIQNSATVCDDERADVETTEAF